MKVILAALGGTEWKEPRLEKKTLSWKGVESFNVAAGGGTQVLCAGRTPGWGGRCQEPVCVFEQDPHGPRLAGSKAAPCK